MKIKDIINDVLSSVIPISIAILLLNFTLVKMPVSDFIEFLFGFLFTTVGFVLFLIGIEVSLFPIGELMGNSLMKKANLWFIIGFGIAMGFALTIAEPAVQVLASQVDIVSNSLIPKYLLMISVSLGLGIFLAIAILRVIFKISIVKIITISYILIFILAILTPAKYFALAFDGSGATTGPVTVPFILALGSGITAMQRTKKSSHDTFGIIAVASIGPILAVLLMGVIFR